jgi:hypothetical protein
VKWHWARSESSAGKALYFHTKGVSDALDARKQKWRRYMAHYVIDGWRECVGLLDEHDVVGVNWLWAGATSTSPATFGEPGRLAPQARPVPVLLRQPLVHLLRPRRAVR